MALLITLAFSSCSEDDTTGTEKRCREIHQNLGAYKQKTLDYSGVTDQGGSISGYFDGGKLIMASVITLGETERGTDEYFFDGENLICVQKQRFIYNRPTYMTEERALKDGDSTWYDDKKTIMKQSYFYFYEDRMVKWIDENKRSIPETDRKYEFRATTLLRDAEKLKTMFVGKDM